MHLKERKATNSGPILVKNYNAIVVKLAYHRQFKILTWKSQAEFFKFCHFELKKKTTKN